MPSSGVFGCTARGLFGVRAQGGHVVVKGLYEPFRELPRGHAFLVGLVYYLVVYIGVVAGVFDLEARVPQVSLYRIEGDRAPGVSYVAQGVDRRPADIHRNLAGR